MRASVMLVTLVASAIVACAGPGESAPSQTSQALVLPSDSASPSPSPRPSGPNAEIRIPIEAGVFPANADGDALIVTRRLIDGRTTRVEAIDLKTRATSSVHETVDATVTVPSIRDGVVALLEQQQTDTPMEYRMRVLAGRWRDAASFKVLDEFTVGFVGGDSWNPYPDPQTNGFEIAWLHTTASPGSATYELRLRQADGTIGTAFSSPRPFTFALARDGQVAIGDIATPVHNAPVDLRLYAGGTVRMLLERPAAGAGYVHWLSTNLLWTNGLGFVVPITSVERIVPATLERATVSAPSGCSYVGATDAQLAFACVDHVELTGGPGPARIGPPLPLIDARGVVRTEQGPPPIAYVTPIITDDPRPGAGAQF